MPNPKKRKKLLLLAQQQTAFRSVIEDNVRIIEFIVPEDAEETEDPTYTTDEYDESEMDSGDIEVIDDAVSRMS